MSEVKKVENKNKKPSKVGVFFSNIGKRFKETFAELKKVTWPDFAKVVKQTGVVLGVVLAFLVCLTAFDLGLQALLKLINGG